jgi:serine protease Do
MAKICQLLKRTITVTYGIVSFVGYGDEQLYGEDDVQQSIIQDADLKESTAQRETAAPVITEHRRSVLPAGTPDSIVELKQIQRAIQEMIPTVKGTVVEIFANGQHGSGVIVSPDGKIYSAAHVIGGAGTKLRLTRENGEELVGKSMGRDQKLDTGIARIETSATYPHVSLATTAPLIGEWVVALGYPGGFDQDRGIVFRLGRVVSIHDGTIQTDCKVIGGDSGGPLFNLRGELIGIHSRIGTGLEDNIHTAMSLFEPLNEQVGSLQTGQVDQTSGAKLLSPLTIDPTQSIYIPGLTEEDVKQSEANSTEGE